MISRAQVPSLLVLCAAIVAGVAVFVLVGRMAGALYGGAALTLGLIFHQKLALNRRADRAPDVEPDVELDVEPDVEPDDEPDDARRRRRRVPALPFGRRAALRNEVARLQADLVERDETRAGLAKQLDDQLERTRQLQASFADRVNDLTAAVQAQKAESASAKEADETRIATLESELARAHEALRTRDATFAAQAKELELQRMRTQELAGRLDRATSVRREELAGLAWRWRAHVEEIGALESAIEAAARSS